MSEQPDGFGNWCPDCGLPRGVCTCEPDELMIFDEDTEPVYQASRRIDDEDRYCRACNGHGLIDDSTPCAECDGTGVDILYW